MEPKEMRAILKKLEDELGKDNPDVFLLYSRCLLVSCKEMAWAFSSAGKTDEPWSDRVGKLETVMAAAAKGRARLNWTPVDSLVGDIWGEFSDKVTCMTWDTRGGSDYYTDLVAHVRKKGLLRKRAMVLLAVFRFNPAMSTDKNSKRREQVRFWKGTSEDVRAASLTWLPSAMVDSKNDHSPLEFLMDPEATWARVWGKKQPVVPSPVVPPTPGPSPRPSSPAEAKGNKTHRVRGEKVSDDNWTLLHLSPNVILEGVPGTGKTHAYRQELLKAYSKAVDCGSMTFHAATSYEDFMEGLRPGMRQEFDGNRPQVEDDLEGLSSPKEGWFFDSPTESPLPGSKSVSAGGMWSVHDGFFVKACIKAVCEPTRAHFVLLDELNRANVPAVMGDLLTLLEPSKRAVWTGAGWKVAHAVHLAASRRRLFVPENLYVIGTMNTVDRSVASLDIALRRRFYIKRMDPMNQDALEPMLADKLKVSRDLRESERLKDCIELWARANDQLRHELGENALLGHSYFFDVVDAYIKARAAGPFDEGGFKPYLVTMFRYALLPQLVETLRAFGVSDAVLSAKPDSYIKLSKVVKGLANAVGLEIDYKDGAVDSYTIRPIS